MSRVFAPVFGSLFAPIVPIPGFRADEPNRCTSCGATNWLVGRQSAKCAVCGAVAPITIPATPTRLED